MSRIAFIRHGAYHQRHNTPSALQPFPLTQEGELEVRRQARMFGDWLQANDLQLAPVVDSSTLLRAWQTADLYIQELRNFFSDTPKIESYTALCERSVGAVANLTIEEIEQVMRDDPRFAEPPKSWKSDSHYCLPFDGAESLMQAGLRVADHVKHYCDHSTSNDIKLIVGHGASIRHAAYTLDVFAFDSIKKLSMHYGHPVVLEFASHGASVQLFGDWKQRQSQDVPD